MKHYVVILIVSALFIGCTSGGRPSNADHSGHDMSANTNSSARTATVDHNAMGHGDATNHSAMQSSPGAASAPYDLQFVDTMTAHHQGAVEMAMLAETRGQHPELKQLAANIVADQEREIAKMSKWRERLFAEKPKATNMALPGMTRGMGGMDLKKLEALKGNEFDLEFLRQMIPHHEGAVEMAKDLQKQDSYAELKELASVIVKSQESEIQQMRDWLSKWQGEKLTN